jgi:hypothetical protein
MTISYNTNLTVLPERILELWPAFQAVRITASLDGLGAVNDFIRYPSRWRVIDANLRRLDCEYQSLNLLGGLATNTAVQIYNVFSVCDLLDYLADSFARLEVPNLSIVTQPEYLSVQVLPSELKQLASERLAAALERSAGRWRARWGAQANELTASINGIMDFMHEADRSELLPRFVDWASHQDAFRDQRTAETIPELAALFGGEGAAT